VKKTTSRFVLALSFISFLFYLTPDDSAEASSAPPVSDVTILGPGTWDRDGVGEGDSSLWPGLSLHGSSSHGIRAADGIS